MGGALSLLWHAQAGPVFAATMNQYKLIEAPNMQSNTRKYLTGGTPRIELIQNGVAYSNLDDLNTSITCQERKLAHLPYIPIWLISTNKLRCREK